MCVANNQKHPREGQITEVSELQKAVCVATISTIAALPLLLSVFLIICSA